jgi:8-oxo-dGTP pyrophosphatase MutT (NUDIX family)
MARGTLTMTLADVVPKLRSGLAAPLPGSVAHLRMVRRPPRGFVPGVLPPDCRHGAVLLLVYEVAGEVRVVLTLRAEGLSRHRGQVSLPGGAMEPGESPSETAVREAVEEIGVPAEAVHHLGVLTPFHVPVSGFIVHPVVAYSEESLSFRAASPEVDRIIEAPLTRLLDPSSVSVEPRVLDGLPYEVPYFDVAGHKVWGATAMILSELVLLLAP